jgi:hypothetical protein
MVADQLDYVVGVDTHLAEHVPASCVDSGHDDEASRRLYEFDSSEHVHYVSSLNTIHAFLTRWAFDLPAD